MFTLLDDLNIELWSNAIMTFVTHQSFNAPFILLFIEESGIPLPIPGDVYLAFVGYRVSQGKMPYAMAFFGLLIAILAGSSILYWLSRRFGNALIHKLGKYIHLNEKKVTYIEEKFKKYGVWVIIFGRHVPGFRVPITFFAGISGISYPTFILSTLISVSFWIIFYLSIGARLGRSVLKLFHADPAYYLFLLLPLFAIAAYFLYPKYKNRKKLQE